MKKRNYFILILIPVFTMFFFLKGPDKEPEISHTSNPALPTLPGMEDWKGTPVDEKGRFQNLYQPFESSFGDLLKWQTSKNPQKAEKKAETRQLPVEFDPAILEGNQDYLIWLGHATFLMRLQGKVMITDPVLIESFFLKRESDLPFPLEELPAIDYILLSHSHRDHCDQKTIQYLAEKNPDLTVLTGLEVGKVLSNWTNGHEIQEAGWFQQFNTPEEGLSITYVPSRHWSRRGLFDENINLWGGFYIQAGSQKLYFMGDSGQGPHFEDIRKNLGAPDYCLMGVGAYKPEWFMHQAHISPLDAIDAFHVLEGKYFIPMHFGTFDLSDEPRMEPWDILVENREAIQGELVSAVIGQNLLKKNILIIN
ncbi:MBL fold metallo-hydrolase [Pararhodonellum marinum]|uniref:MBL fold metallo-hydrolase n=1 Tax=Pararhodonellum marinum TaxID=2755358 RepID=UPI00188EB2E1|nr:MBL fold metallo-hydrolase [Pararhodonellum marinum]